MYADLNFISGGDFGEKPCTVKLRYTMWIGRDWPANIFVKKFEQ